MPKQTVYPEPPEPQVHTPNLTLSPNPTGRLNTHQAKKGSSKGPRRTMALLAGLRAFSRKELHKGSIKGPPKRFL